MAITYIESSLKVDNFEIMTYFFKIITVSLISCQNNEILKIHRHFSFDSFNLFSLSLWTTHVVIARGGHGLDF